MQKIVILIPLGIRTGGPEACFQLSDALLKQGFDARVWLLTPQDIEVLQGAAQSGFRLKQHEFTVPLRTNPIEEYFRYESRPFEITDLDPSTVFVLPEVYAWAVPMFEGFPVLLWWLSVDNAFAALGRVNLNHLRLPLVSHACQSVYARQVVEALGLKATMLSDYTIVPAVEAAPIEERPLKLCVNAGGKVIFNLDRLEHLIHDQEPQAEVVRIAQLTREQVYAHFASSRLFVDMGHLPGKDRMVREALLLGANGLIARAGAGMNPVDFPFHESCLWKIDHLEDLVDSAVRLLRNPVVHYKRLEPVRDLIRLEQHVFDAEVATTMASLAPAILRAKG